ncbi:alpha/beta fold hydrolase [Streptomyces hyaluromycini]|uniref:alpha/beta fold hydrolase n=1 Tax=Streptomyces hyaluromycini TaxID=1377993 RepID=UPI000B5CA4EE|nr:alpha/beta hydrolase [Streptomyces hyaluromycini]
MPRFARIAVAVPAFALTICGMVAAGPPTSAQQRPADVPTATSTSTSRSHATTGSAATVVERTIHGDGVDLFVRAVGSPRAETTVVALHGGPGLSSDYMRAFEKLASDHVRVVTWDQRGTGRSTKPADGDYSVASYVADLEAVRQSLGAPHIVLLGHSWGGLMASAYTAAHPDRVRALGLIDAEPADGAAAQAGLQPFNARLAKLVGDGVIRLPIPDVMGDDCTAQLKALFPVYFADPSFVPPPGALDTTTCSASAGAATNQGLTAETFAGIASGLAQYRGPALILSGADDPFGSGWVKAGQQELAHAQPRVVVVPNAGHFPWLEQPEPSFAAVRALVCGS